MKTMKYYLTPVVVCLISGCSTTFRPWNLSQIQEGMAREQVVMILGEPDSQELKNNSECLHYVYVEDYNPSPSTIPLYYEDTERAFRDLNSDQAFKEYEYEVILVDGRVINYKEVE